MKDTGHEKIKLLWISFHPYSTFILANSSTAASIMLLHCHILSPITTIPVVHNPEGLLSVLVVYFQYCYIDISVYLTLVQWNLSFATPPFRGHKIWSQKSVHITFVFVSSMKGTPPLKGHKIWSQKNVQINFVSVTSIGTPLFRGEGHFF